MRYGRQILLWMLVGSVLLNPSLSDALQTSAEQWQQWRTDIQADPSKAEQALQTALDQEPETAAPSPVRTVLGIRLLTAQFAQGADSEAQLTRMSTLADQAALQGDIVSAMHAWRECSRRYFLKGDYARAQSAAQHLLDAARQIGARKDEAQALNDLGVLAKRRGDIRTAIIHYENALAIRRIIDDRAGAAQTLGNLALIEKNRGALLKALSYQREAQAIRIALGQPAPIASAHDSLGLIYLAMGDADEAERQFRAALSVGDLPKNQDNIVNSRNNLAIALLKQGRVEEAGALAEQVYAYVHERNLRPSQVSAATNLASVARRRGDTAAAGRYAEEALTLGRQIGDSKEIIEPLLERAEWQLAKPDPKAAEKDLEEALSLARRDQLRLLEYQALELKSRTLLASGEAEQAFQVRQDFERMRDELMGADTLRQMAELLRRTDTVAVPVTQTAEPTQPMAQPGLHLFVLLTGLIAGFALGARLKSGD